MHWAAEPAKRKLSEADGIAIDAMPVIGDAETSGGHDDPAREGDARSDRIMDPDEIHLSAQALPACGEVSPAASTQS